MKPTHANDEIRKHAKMRGVLFWQIAEALNISPSTLTKYLRHELAEESQKILIGLIDEIADTPADLRRTYTNLLKQKGRNEKC